VNALVPNGLSALFVGILQMSWGCGLRTQEVRASCLESCFASQMLSEEKDDALSGCGRVQADQKKSNLECDACHHCGLGVSPSGASPFGICQAY
jgi:hypothetical protein